MLETKQRLVEEVVEVCRDYCFVKEEKSQLTKKLKTSEQDRQSTLAGLKTTEAQAEDQHKRLFTTELDLAMEKAVVLSLKAELEKAKAEAQAI